jgi:hypothetical protein
MWVIIASKDKNELREDVISDLLDFKKEKKLDTFVNRRNNRYHLSLSLSNALIYKQRSSCEKLVKKFNTADKTNYRSVFVWIKDFHLSYRRIDKDEWNRMCDTESNALTRQYEIQKNDIEKKRLMIQ